MALASTVQEAMWLRQLMSDLTSTPAKTVEINEDNQSAISMTKNPQFYGRAKHIDIKFHFIREQVESEVVALKYCPTENMLADVLTKGVSRDRFCKLRNLIGIEKKVSV